MLEDTRPPYAVKRNLSKTALEKDRERQRRYAKTYRKKKTATGADRATYKLGGKAYVYAMYTRAKVRAKRDGVPFDIQPSDIMIPENCPIFGTPLVIAEGAGKKGPKDNSPSLDKRIPSLGYVKGNIEVISFKANRLKNSNTKETLSKLLEYIESGFHK
jgi:hypothetical protein